MEGKEADMKAYVVFLSAGGLLVAGSQLAHGQTEAAPPAAAPSAAAPAQAVVTTAPPAPVVVTTTPPPGAPASAVQTAPSGATQQVQIFTAPAPPAPPPPPQAPVVVMPAPPPPPCPVCPPAPVIYAAPVEPPGRHAHDGLFLRLSAGGGYLGARDERTPGNATFHGSAGAFALAVGGAVGNNLILFGEVVGQQVETGELELSYGDHPRDDSRDVTGSMGLYGGGPGLAYYFMPYNTYISGTLLFTRLVWSEDDLGEENSDEDNVQSEPGVGLSLAVGKEWWVSSNWGLGVAARVNYSSNEHASNRRLDRFGDTTQSPRDRRFDVWGLSLALSATFN
jgi:hypothetical protein